MREIEAANVQASINKRYKLRHIPAGRAHSADDLALAPDAVKLVGLHVKVAHVFRKVEGRLTVGHTLQLVASLVAHQPVRKGAVID